jgi:hypothetical protein
MPNGDGGGGGGFDFGGIFDSLLGSLVAIIQAILDFLASLVTALVQVLNFLYQGELGIFDFTRKGTDGIWHIFKNLVEDVFKLHVLKALHDLFDLYKKLQTWIAKLKKFLDRLRRIQQLQQLQALRRMLNLIQRVRRILVVFKLLHIGIAKKLDNFLARLEGRLSTSVFRQFRKTNEIIRWLNLIADPRGLLHPGGILSGVGGIINAIGGALDALRPGEFNCVPGQQTGPGVPVLPWVSVRQQLASESKNNSGDTAAVGRQFASMRELFAADIGDAAKLRAGG